MAHVHRSAGGEDNSRRGRRLLIALALNLGITVAELIGGLISGSLALIADAAHNFSDAASILASYIAWRISQRQADKLRTFGYARAETVGAVINLTTLLLIGLYLLYEAVSRLITPTEIASTTMLVVGVIALVEDLAAAWVLRKETGSLNVKSTFLHMIADAMTTVGVIIAALAIMAWGSAFAWLDPLITGLIALYIWVHGYHEIKKSIAVLIDSAPRDFDYDGLVASLHEMAGVEDVHHLHVWQREEGKLALEAHVALSETDFGRATELKEAAKTRLKERFGIDHATIEIELADKVSHDRSLLARERK
ncbi:cation diffusion facilitator family transporter [Ensifer sp. P24N7]|uniref:cation diffusion facilitator family transporter n=1 Tax=Sinorhizobium sp. P24N7 TaxID=3348358 RepID=UPI0035F39BE1